MSYSGDAAEQVVRMSLEGTEVAVKLAGSGAKQLAILLYAILREQTKTKGKTRLTNMLRSGKELKVFAVKDSDLQLFCREAKKYGVLYCVLKDKSAKDGISLLPRCRRNTARWMHSPSGPKLVRSGRWPEPSPPI